MDLKTQNDASAPEIQRAIERVLKEQSFIKGPEVEGFTAEFLEAHGGRFGVACANGTSAITVALRALKLGPGDEVLVPNHTFFGTVEPIVEVGATPVLVEIDENFGQLDLGDARRRLTPKTKAIVPVHLYGLPEPMDEVMAFANEHELDVIEDCAQAHLAKWDGQAVGSFGAFGTFSFYPGKNLGAFGDAGFLLTESEAHFEFARRYVDHGRTDKYVHEFFGGNFRMDGLQGAILRAKLPRLAAGTEHRRELARRYDQHLRPAGFKVLTPRAKATPVYHLYVVEVSNRDEVTATFKKKGIGCGVHYPVTMSQQPAFGPSRTRYPVSERRAARILSLPFYPEMTAEQLNFVSETFLEVAKI